MAILSIQSHVVYGHAGNSSAVFPLQRLGHEVWAINTVEFSNHTGYGKWTGDVLRDGLVSDLVRGLEERGVLGQCQAVLSGYMGDKSSGAQVLEAVKKVKAASPRALYCCDPVMGDVGRGFYVREGIFEFFRDEALAACDILTPNQFELDALTGGGTPKIADARAAIDKLHERGPRVVLVTSYKESGLANGLLQMLVSDGSALYAVTTPELAFETGNVIMAGSGDLTAAVFLSSFLQTGSAKTSLERTAGAVFSIMEATHKAHSYELLLVEAQENLIKPSRVFTAEKI